MFKHRHIYRLFIITVLAFMAIIIYRYPLRIMTDVGLFVCVGRRILDGQQPYVDYYDINFPIFHYLNAIPVGLASILNVHSVTMLLVMVWCVCLWSAWTCFRLSKQFWGDADLFGTHVISLSIALYSLNLLVKNQFAQREHIFVLLFLPGFLVRLNRWESTLRMPRRTALVYGVLAGCGVAIKPYFVLIPLVTEMYWVVMRRDFSKLVAPEALGFALVGGLHALYFILFQESAQGLWDAQKLALAGYDAKMRVLPQTMLHWPRVEFGLLIGGLPFALWTRFREPTFQIARPFGLVTLTGIIILIVQKKGYEYHSIIFEIAGLITLGFILQRLTTEAVNGLAQPSFTLVTLTAVLVTFTFGNVYLNRHDYFLPYVTAEKSFVEEHVENDETLLLLSPNIGFAYPWLAQLDRHQSSHYMVSFPFLMGYYQVPTDRVLSPDYPKPASVQKWLDIIIEDIEARPRFILIDKYGDLDEYLAVQGIIRDYIAPAYVIVDEQWRYTAYKYADPQTPRR